MRFEEGPSETYKYALVFEAEQGEVEPVAAAYREKVFLMAKKGLLAQVYDSQRQFSEWDNSIDRTILTSHPLSIALMLESFHDRTGEAVQEIVANPADPPFDNDDIARRMRLGDKAFQLAGLIKLEHDQDSLQALLEEGVDVFLSPNLPPAQAE